MKPNREELERAIDLQRKRIEFEDDCYPKDVDEFILTVLRAALDREANEPPKCYECKNEADSWECERCIWGDKADRYEPKGEKA